MLIKLYFCNARIRYSMDFSFNSKRNAFIDSHSIGWVNSTHRICSTVTNLFSKPKRERANFGTETCLSWSSQ